MSDGNSNRPGENRFNLDRSDVAILVGLAGFAFSGAGLMAELVGDATRQAIADCVADNNPVDDCIKQAGTFGREENE